MKKNSVIALSGLISIGIIGVVINSYRQQNLIKFYDQGISKFSEGKYEQAISEFDNAISNKPLIYFGSKVDNSFYFKCSASYQLKKYDLAKINCTEAINKLNDKVPGIGLLFKKESDLKYVIEQIQKKFPVPNDQKLQVGDEIIRIDGFEIKKIGFIQAIDKIYDGKVDDKIKLSVNSIDGKETQHTLNRLLLPNPRKELAYYYRGLSKLQQEDYSNSIPDFDLAIQFNPDLARYYLHRGIAKSKSNQKQDAITDLNRAIDMDSKLGDAYYNLGIIYNDQNTPELRRQAIKDLKKAIELNPQNLEAYQQLGGIQDDLGNKLEAINLYTSAIKISSPGINTIKLYLSRGKTLCNFGRIKEGILDFQYIIQEVSGISQSSNGRQTIMASAYHNMADCKNQSGDSDGAIHDYSAAIRMDENNYLSYFNRAVLFNNTKDYDTAIEDLKLVISKKNDFASAYYYLALIHEAQGKKSEAVLYIKQAIKLNPKINLSERNEYLDLLKKLESQ